MALTSAERVQAISIIQKAHEDLLARHKDKIEPLNGKLLHLETELGNSTDASSPTPDRIFENARPVFRDFLLAVVDCMNDHDNTSKKTKAELAQQFGKDVLKDKDVGKALGKSFHDGIIGLGKDLEQRKQSWDSLQLRKGINPPRLGLFDRLGQIM
ncbi:hypothetical protein BCR34DRAFT_582326 [Clohesyomyces aquaticus]|uniref:Uncharacterized protein n=1 Tax=Clohesyomyces aquaticus TaxID=1231657 RepID=A0A1Y2A9F5_9PLEO|nr:hypothetical protein BCR34DRAFT_582326 [Clohesyomyces aquaticus]